MYLQAVHTLNTSGRQAKGERKIKQATHKAKKPNNNNNNASNSHHQSQSTINTFEQPQRHPYPHTLPYRSWSICDSRTSAVVARVFGTVSGTVPAAAADPSPSSPLPAPSIRPLEGAALAASTKAMPSDKAASSGRGGGGGFLSPGSEDLDWESGGKVCSKRGKIVVRGA